MQAMTKQRHMDMLNGPLWSKLPRYALPVAATGILGQLFNAADVAVVGNFTGELRTVAPYTPPSSRRSSAACSWRSSGS